MPSTLSSTSTSNSCAPFSAAQSLEEVTGSIAPVLFWFLYNGNPMQEKSKGMRSSLLKLTGVIHGVYRITAPLAAYSRNAINVVAYRSNCIKPLHETLRLGSTRQLFHFAGRHSKKDLIPWARAGWIRAFIYTHFSDQNRAVITMHNFVFPSYFHSLHFVYHSRQNKCAWNADMQRQWREIYVV